MEIDATSAFHFAHQGSNTTEVLDLSYGGGRLGITGRMSKVRWTTPRKYPLPPERIPCINPRPVQDAGSDGGSGDAGSDDAGSDAGQDDAGASDAGASDAGASDAGPADAGAPDAGNRCPPAERLDTIVSRWSVSWPRAADRPRLTGGTFAGAAPSPETREGTFTMEFEDGSKLSCEFALAHDVDLDEGEPIGGGCGGGGSSGGGGGDSD